MKIRRESYFADKKTQNKTLIWKHYLKAEHLPLKLDALVCYCCLWTLNKATEERTVYSVDETTKCCHRAFTCIGSRTQERTTQPCTRVWGENAWGENNPCIMLKHFFFFFKITSLFLGKFSKTCLQQFWRDWGFVELMGFQVKRRMLRPYGIISLTLSSSAIGEVCHFTGAILGHLPLTPINKSIGQEEKQIWSCVFCFLTQKM